jgi:hypothetical protein
MNEGGSTQTVTSSLVAPNTSILRASLDGAQQILKEHTMASLGINSINSVWVAGKQHFRKWARELGGQTLKLPGLAFQIQDVKIPTDHYNSFAMKHLGVDGPTSDDESFMTRYFLTPVQISFITRFVTKDYEELINFMSGWMYQMERAFVLSDNNSFEPTFGLRPDPNLTVPEDELDDTGTLFIMEAPVQLYTFTGNKQKVPLLKTLKYTVNLTDGDKKPISLSSRTFNFTNTQQNPNINFVEMKS